MFDIDWMQTATVHGSPVLLAIEERSEVYGPGWMLDTLAWLFDMPDDIDLPAAPENLFALEA